MNTSFNALVVPARLAHPVHMRPVELDMAALQRVAAGEIGFIASRDWHVYLDHDGNRTAQNMRAEILIREAGVDLDGTVHGTAIFLGRRNGGEDADAPHHLVRLAEQLFDLPLAA
ncbi:hypothetical protein [Arthrobacter sp. B6]|uniref:hypothetical protein n=1 Tax=Arthrobacter sp. B6 TaxID=1570137 RepID=UPI0008350DB9|nr:hypothetical protein [Arthrobacter sp. B6]